ncbi:MAG: nucleotidyl transferase AbiEii/AbiGii toxin family protein [Chloroflexota bacterium]
MSRQGSVPAFIETLEEAISVLQNAGIPYVIGGGLAARAYGRRRLTKDIDIFVKREDAERSLDALAEAGFRTERTDPDWLLKAFKRGILVDIIFRSSGNVFIDDRTLGRAGEISIGGHRVKVLPPEDLLVMKTMAMRPDVPRHWRDAIAVLRGARLDWDYLLERARVGPDRILGVLLLAKSEGVAVPEWVIRRLISELYPLA